MSVFFSLVTGALLVLGLLLIAAHLWTRRMAADAGRMVPRAGAVQRVGGGTIHFVDMGRRDGMPVVMIHGLSGQVQHFTYAIAGLLADDYRVIAVDRPGCGYSTLDQGDGAALGDQARMIGELLEAQGIGRAVLAGHSLGGAVALRMALDRPDQVAALALLCPLTVRPPQTPDALKGLEIETSWLRRMLGATIAVPLARITADKVLSQVFDPEQCPEDFLDRAGGVLGLRPRAFVTAAADMCTVNSQMGAQAARYIAELNASGGVLFGAQDATLDPAVHGAPMQSLGLAFETLDGRGHMIPITAPDDCAAFIRRMAGEVAA